MKCFFTRILYTLLFTLGAAHYSQDKPREPREEKEQEKEEKKELTEKEISLLSQAYGHMIGQGVTQIDLNLEPSQIIVGIQNAFSGSEAPLTEAKTIEMITDLREQKFRKESEVNLKAAEAFLATNIKNKNIHEIEKGLQYKELKKGNGKVCTKNDKPMISYTGSYMNGQVFGQSTQPEAITLSETIEGFQKAIIGMKVGEKREVYIHPNLGYGTKSSLEPNALLTFEIELTDINHETSEQQAPKEEHNTVQDFPEGNTLADSDN